MSYKEEGKDLTYYKANAEEDYMQVPISVLRYITELEKKVKQSQSNLLDQKIDEEGCEIEKPDIKDDEFGDYYSRLKRWEGAPTLRQEREDSKQNLLTANRIINEQSEELKRLKEENEKLVNSVGEWSALAIDRKQDLDEANKKIEELKEGIDEILDLYHGDGVINQTWILIHLKELKKSLTK